MSQIAPASLEPFSSGPFPVVDSAGHVFQSLGLAGAFPCTLVSKAWHNAMQHPSIWLALFDTESIPRIEGRVETAKEDFQFIHTRTHGAKQMALLGRFVGLIPLVNRVMFETFKTAMDPYDPKKRMSETWVFVIEPEIIYRDDADGDLSKVLKAEGDLDASAEADDLKNQGVLIPYSLKNLKVCAENPVAKKGAKIFSYFNPRALKECNTISKAARLTLMRLEVPESTRNKTWLQQKEELAKHGHVAVTLSTRMFYNAVNILNKGTCPDKQEGNRASYTRTSTEVKVGNKSFPFGTGGYAPDIGSNVNDCFDYAADDCGAVPTVLAVVPS